MNITSKLLISLTLIWGPAWAEGPVEISGAEYDFGQVVTNSTLAHTIWIRAAGTDTLTLTDVKTGCGCVTSPWAVSTIRPGDSLALTFYWQTRGSVGDQELSAYLYLKPENFPQKIVLSGNVVTPDDLQASLDWRPSVLRLSGGQDGGLSVAFDLTNRTSETLTATVVESSPGLTVAAPDSIEPGKAAGGRIRLESGQTDSTFEGSVTLELTGNQSGGIRVSLPVQYGDFSFRPFFTTKQK
jgi:hypothetical protein